MFNKAFSVVTQNAAVAMAQPSLFDTSYSLLIEVIKSDSLKIEEIDLFHRVGIKSLSKSDSRRYSLGMFTKRMSNYWTYFRTLGTISC